MKKSSRQVGSSSKTHSFFLCFLFCVCCVLLLRASKRKRLCVCTYFSTCSHTPMVHWTRVSVPKPAHYFNLPCWEEGSHYVYEQLQRSSSPELFFRLKASSQSCTAALLALLHHHRTIRTGIVSEVLIKYLNQIDKPFNSAQRI